MAGEGITTGSVASEIAAEFPGIGLLSCGCPAAKSSAVGVVQELELLAQRMNGPKAVHLPAEPVAAAYRALRVGLGMEADSGAGTVEALARRRLVEGGFRPEGQPADAATIATLETGVPIQILAAGPGAIQMGIDPTNGAVSILRGDVPVAVLFAEPEGEAAPNRKATEVQLVAVIAPGVLPEVVELALDRTRSLCQH